MANILQLQQHVQNGFDAGRQRGERTYLGKLMGQAYQTDDPAQQRSILGQMAQVSPETAPQFSQQMGADRQQRMTAWGQKLSYFVAQAKNGNQQMVASLYPQLAQEARAFGLGDVPLEYNPSYLPGLEQAAQAFGSAANAMPAGYQEFDLLTKAGNLSPEDRNRAARVRLGLDGRASNAGYGFDVVEDANGNPRPQRRNPRDGSVEVFHDETGQWVPLGAAGGGPAPVQQRTGSAPDNYADVQGTLDAIGQKYGFETTSTVRSPEENSAVGGVANSQHMTGTARDYSIKGKSPQEIQAMVAELKSAGFEVIASDHGTGPHIHAELPPGAQVAAGGGMPAYGSGGGGSASNAPVAPPARPADPYANSPYINTNVNNVGGGVVTPPGLGRGRRSEDKVAAEERVRRDVGLEFADREADAAARAAQAKKEAELAAERAGKREVRSDSANDLMTLLDEADKLIPQSTGSTAGAAVDATASFFGGTTQGAEAIAKLKTIAGQIVAKMPRMEGPQSDRDVKMYHDMAGNLADPTVPAAQRKAAAMMIRALNTQYADQQPTAPAANDGIDDLVNRWSR